MKQITLVLILGLCCQYLIAQPALTVQNAKMYELVSKLNKNTYKLGVSVPESYDASKKYPVFYILDGFYASEIAHGAHRTLDFYKEIEDLIVVTISGTEKTMQEWFINRWGDLTFTKDLKNDSLVPALMNLPSRSLHSGKGDLFLQVITKEIFPIIEKNYSTNGKRGIAGHSLGGLFVANLLFNTNGIFEKFGINSPSLTNWNQNDIRQAEKMFAEKHKNLQAQVLLTFGALEGEKKLKDINEFEQLLKTHYNDLDVKTIIFDGETHASVVSAMLSRNIFYLYKNNEKK